MQRIQPLRQGNFYHIYNRGNNSCRIFEEANNYTYFQKLFAKYISPVAESYVWVLMPTHFHFLVRMKEWEELTAEENNTKSLHQSFSNLFNAYAKAFNKRYHRHGSLFERPFRRKLVKDQKYLMQLVVYIHNNPVQLGMVDHPAKYEWSSYRLFFENKTLTPVQQQVIDWFGSLENFEYMHLRPR